MPTKAALLAVFTACATALLAAPAAFANPVATQYDAPHNTLDMVSGPGGDLFTTWQDGRDYGVSRVTTAGLVSDLADLRKEPAGIAAGPDGNLWVTTANRSTTGRARIVRITPAGETTEFLDGISPGAKPRGITTGPDGALWFAESGLPQVGRIATDGTVTEYPVPRRAGSTTHIAAGPDGRLWFTEGNAKKIGAITTSGVVTQYRSNIPDHFVASTIIPGPDGRLWYTADTVVRQQVLAITTAGESSLVSSAFQPFAAINELTVGSDGNVWAAEGFEGAIARITPAGDVTELTGGLPDGYHPLFSIVNGPDNRLWFTDSRRVGTIAAQVDNATQPDVVFDSVPPSTITTRRRRVQLDFAFTATPADASLHCQIEAGRTPETGGSACAGSLSYRVRTARRAYWYTLVVSAHADGVIDSTPAIYRVKVKRRD